MKPPLPEKRTPGDAVPEDAPHWRREHFIPVRKAELIRWLSRRPELTKEERREFLRVCQVLDATFHFEYQRQLEQLKEAYAIFNPDLDTRTLRHRTEEEREELAPRVFDAFTHVLERANYERLSQGQIQEVVGAASDWGVRLDVDFDIFERLDVFVRGDVIGTRTRRRMRNLYRPETVPVPIYQRLVVIFRLNAVEPDPPKRRKSAKSRAKDDDPEQASTPDESGTAMPPPQDFDSQRHIFVKLFKNIPKVDVDMLLPGARIRLSLLDRGKIVLPTLSGLIMAGVKIVKGAVLAALFGGIAGIIAFTAFVVGTIGYGIKSFFGYLRTKDKYQLNLTRNLYYQNLDNNGGVLFRLLDEAEAQECREAVVAYFLLWRHAGSKGWTPAELDQAAERLFRDELEMDVDFETHDAVDKLLRLGIARQSADGRLTALPAELAAAQLDRTWDSCFSHESSTRL